MKRIISTSKNIISTSALFAILCMIAFGCVIPKKAHADIVGFCGGIVDPKGPDDDESEICKKFPECCQKSPCTVAKGNYITSVTDLQIPTRGFPLVVDREYSTDRVVDGFFGFGWSSNLTSRLTYATYLYAAPSTYRKMAAIVMPNGGVYKFTENADGSFTSPSGIYDTLVKNGDGSFDLTLELSRRRFHYDPMGYLTTMTDAYNNSLSFTYDSGTGRLMQVSDATGSGRFLSLTYNATGQIDLIQDHTGRQIQYQYVSGKLTRVIDPQNRNTDYSYVQGRFSPLLSQIKDHWGRVITDITYDGSGRVYSYTDEGEYYRYTYRPDVYGQNFNKTLKTDSSNANVWTFTYNSAGQVTQTEPPEGQGSTTSTVTYNSNGLVQDSVDETGVRTSYTYNTNGSAATVTRDAGGPQSVRFDYTYDTNFPEKVTSIIAKDPTTGQLNLDWQGQKFDYYQLGSPAPGALFHVYRVKNDGSSLDTLATFTYNSFGQTLNATSATGGVTAFDYNPTTGDLTSITFPKNSTSGQNPVYNYGRDSLGRLSSITNPLGKSTAFTHDNVDRVLTVTIPKPTPSHPQNFVTTYTYDQYDGPSGLVFTNRTDANGRITKQGYDQFGQLNKSIDVMNNATIFQYNKGLLESITDANGNVTTYTYNALRQLVAVSFPEGLSESYMYWEDGLIKSKTDRKNQTINYSYDHLKRETQKLYPNSTSITFTFVGQKLTTVTDTFAGETHSFSYDTSYRVSSNTQGTRGTVSYTYDSADRFTTYSVSGGGPTATYTYYDDGSLKTIVWSPVTGSFTYNYTLNGQYSSIVFPNNQQRNLTYDDQGRLTQIVNNYPNPGPGNLATYNYGYDTNNYGGSEMMLGQRTSMNATVPSQNFNNHQTTYYYDGNYQLTEAHYPNVTPFSAEVDKWTYDAIGNRTANIVNGTPQNYTYFINPGNSNNGQRLQSDGINTYVFDNNGNLTGKSGPSGNFTFEYDYDDRLISISGSTTASYTYDYIGRRSSKNVGGITTHIYNGQDLIAQRGATIADFLFGKNTDDPLAMYRNSNAYYFDVDGLGSTNLINNTSGSIQNKYVFDAWGNVRSQTLAIANPFGYTNREFAEASLLFYRNRYLSPSIGKFTGEDPLRFAAGINLYAYTLNSPVIFVDPTGLSPCTDFVHDLMVIANTSANPYQAGRILVNSFIPPNEAFRQMREDLDADPLSETKTPRKFDGFRPELTDGGQNQGVYLHVAAAAAAMLEGKDHLVFAQEILDTLEGLFEPGKPIEQGDAEFAGDLVGAWVGLDIYDYMKGKLDERQLFERLRRNLCKCPFKK